MAKDSAKKGFPWLTAAVVLVVSAGAAYAAVLWSDSREASKAESEDKASSAPPPAAAPLNIEFLGTKAPQGADPAAAKLAADDAMVVWLRSSGGGRGRTPMTLVDEKGKSYSYSPQRGGEGLIALHIKKGYDTQPKQLSLSVTSGDQKLGPWKIDGMPAPQVVLPDAALGGAPAGKVVLQKNQRGRISAVAQLTEKLSPTDGVVLDPIASTYTAIVVPDRQRASLISPAGKPASIPIPLPNADRARQVSFTEIVYHGVARDETVTFKNARIEDHFGQPTLVVDKEETVTTASGIKVILPVQDVGPRRHPRHTHPEVTVTIALVVPLASDELGHLQPSLSAAVASPTPAELGLQKVKLNLTPSYPDGTIMVFGLPVDHSAASTSATVTPKIGPITALTLRIHIVEAKVLAKKKIVLPVDSKIVDAPRPTGGGPGNPTAL